LGKRCWIQRPRCVFVNSCSCFIEVEACAYSLVAIATAVVVAADGLVAEVHAELSTHDFVIVEVSNG
jgi:hypothetical protein